MNVLFDEIHIKPKLEYRGGRLVGAATEQKLIANKIQAFMLTSLYSKNQDVIALYPVKQSSANLPEKLILEVTKVLTEVGFTIITLIGDNHRMNRAAYGLLSQKFAAEDPLIPPTILNSLKVSPCIKNPFKPDSTIFLLFDTVHLFKSIRNNWLNQSNLDESFIYPHFDNHNLILHANLSDLKKLYSKECENISKEAPALTKKVLFPSSFERQNVLLAVKLFDEKTIVALENKNNEQISGTAEFLKVILNWWKIVNARSPPAGHFLKDPLRNAINCPTHDSLSFLLKFVEFLDAWQQQNYNFVEKRHTGKLSPDTFFSLKHTCRTFVLLSRYLLENVPDIKYVLLGKFQTDQIEGRFGLYRMLSGSNYYVSVSQILESEKKLKILSLLKLNSNKFGIFSFKELCDLDDFLDSEEDSLEIELHPFSDILTSDIDINLQESEINSLCFIAGYCSHGLIKYVNNCENCTLFVTSNNEFSVDFKNQDVSDYISRLTRGSLKSPSQIIFDITIECYLIFSEILSETYEILFLNHGAQRLLLKKLFIQKIENSYDNLEDKCSLCNKNIRQLIGKQVHILSNIFLNNYSKVMTDHVPKANDSNQRKMLTFTT